MMYEAKIIIDFLLEIFNTLTEALISYLDFWIFYLKIASIALVLILFSSLAFLHEKRSQRKVSRVSPEGATDIEHPGVGETTVGESLPDPSGKNEEISPPLGSGHAA